MTALQNKTMKFDMKEDCLWVKITGREWHQEKCKCNGYTEKIKYKPINTSWNNSKENMLHAKHFFEDESCINFSTVIWIYYLSENGARIDYGRMKLYDHGMFKRRRMEVHHFQILTEYLRWHVQLWNMLVLKNVQIKQRKFFSIVWI